KFIDSSLNGFFGVYHRRRAQHHRELVEVQKTDDVKAQTTAFSQTTEAGTEIAERTRQQLHIEFHDLERDLVLAVGQPQSRARATGILESRRRRRRRGRRV